jgi:hypothetical protein
MVAIIIAYNVLHRGATGYVQTGGKLVGTGAVGAAEQGVHAAISSDGTTALVGGWRDDDATGAAWFYRRSGEEWLQDGPKVKAEDAAGVSLFGFSVALSADGSTAIIGGIYDDQSTGAAWIFTRKAGAWKQQGPKLVGTHIKGAGNFGFSVALSADGNTAIIGGCFDSAGVGAAWVFTRTGDGWAQQGEKLLGSGIRDVLASVGTSVALSADGNTAIVGGNTDNQGVGAAWVFTRARGIWAPEGKLVGTNAVGEAHQGNSVAISADGSVAIVGGYFDDGHKGATWSFRRTNGIWTQVGEKLVGSGAVGASQQGISVALSADGSTAAIGGDLDGGDAGAVWVFTRTGDSWTQAGAKLQGKPASGAHQGSGVAITADAGMLLVGGPHDEGKTGSAWVFTRAHAGRRFQ